MFAGCIAVHFISCLSNFYQMFTLRPCVNSFQQCEKRMAGGAAGGGGGGGLGGRMKDKH